MPLEDLIEMVSEEGNIMEMSVVYEVKPEALPTESYLRDKIRERIKFESERNKVTIETHHFFPQNVVTKEKFTKAEMKDPQVTKKEFNGKFRGGIRCIFGIK